ncbi:MAG: hypothetical protein Q9222_006939, partial [Ikaeria aurantiellina]
MSTREYLNEADARAREVSKKHQDYYRMMRDSFQSNPLSKVELPAWKSQANDFDYQLLNIGKSFIPSKLIGTNPLQQLKHTRPWAKADTFFSEYELHNKPSLILSATKHSYVIGNEASYDCRLYPLRARWEKRPEGQGFGHLLIIPRKRIYNVVDPEATANGCFVLTELADHFKSFWESPRGPEMAAGRARDGNRSALNRMSLAEMRADYLVRDHVNEYYERSFPEFIGLKTDDFMMGFHVFPENTIGHLHMHVYPLKDSLRTYSTRDYDYKTVPLQAVLDAESEDQELRRKGDG